MFMIETQRMDTQVEPFATFFGFFKKKGLSVPAPLKLMSASAPLFDGYAVILKHYADHADLGAGLRTAIRYHVAAVSGFKACVEFNEVALEMAGMAQDIENLSQPIPKAALPTREQLILSFVSDALFRSHLIDRARIAQMKQEGISEQTLVDATMHGGLLLMLGPVVAAFMDKD